MKVKVIIFLCMILMGNGFDPMKFSMSQPGHRFEPANSVEFLSIFTNVRSTISCAMMCYRNNLCRTFNFDLISKACRLFEGSLDTGSLLPNFPSTVVGWINIDPSMFTSYNATSSRCVNNRFLDSTSVSGRCECPTHTFWNGSMCLNERYAGASCSGTKWCRTELWLNCISSMCVGKACVSVVMFCLQSLSSSLVFSMMSGVLVDFGRGQVNQINNISFFYISRIITTYSIGCPHC